MIGHSMEEQSCRWSSYILKYIIVKLSCDFISVLTCTCIAGVLHRECMPPVWENRVLIYVNR